MNTYNLTQQIIPKDQLLKIYTSLQAKPWGHSLLVEGYFFIGHISPISYTPKGRAQATATVYWKQFESDAFNIEVAFKIPLGPLYNESSKGATNVSMDLLLGLTIKIAELIQITYSVIWEIVDESFPIPDDVVYDLFYTTEEHDMILADQQAIDDAEAENYGNQNIEEENDI